MDKRPLAAEGLSIEIDGQIQIGALRYCAPVEGEAALRRVTGSGVPEARRAVLCTGAQGGESVSLLWRSPSETLVASASAAPLAALAAQLASATQACLVDQSGGFWALRITGSRCTDLLVRLGATTAVPRLGESLPGRLAELTVLSACVRESEVLLLVERLYADHLLGWIRETIADF
jgi:heterotetrameric sarcosine oxidase gamma subunit